MNSSDALLRYNVTLWIRDWANKTSFGNVNVTIFDPLGKRSTSKISNQTGHVDLKLIESGTYIISVQTGNRIVGYQEIAITKNATHLIRTWAYDFNITLVDSHGNRLANHTVMLYDQLDFGSPLFSYMSNVVVRRQNITLMTERIGRLVAQTMTNNNGTLSFPAVWNGTYLLKVIGVETIVKEYVLGELKITRIPPAVGQGIMALQNSLNITLPCIRANFQLHLVTASNRNVTRAQVYTRDMNGYLFYSDVSNDTGHVEHKDVYFIDGKFKITVRYGNRTIGYREIEITETKVFTIVCWTNNLTIMCVNLNNNPLIGYVVLLYDQVVFYSPTNITVITNQTKQLINWTKTDIHGKAQFTELWNGTYWITVSSGEIVKEMIIDLQETKTVIITGESTKMLLKFVTRTGQPLSKAVVTVFDSSQNLVFREYTDDYGQISRQNLRIGSYTVNVEWMGTQVASQTVNVQTDYGRTITCGVFRLTLNCKDQFGNPLSKADVVLETINERIKVETDTDNDGVFTMLLPQGTYRINVDHGIFSSSLIIDLLSDQSHTITCNIKSIIFVSLMLLIVPLAFFTVVLERRKLRTPLEIRKYKNMLAKLETMYKNGQVEYKIYRKLKEEYDSKIMELGGREMR
ncbi:MAG: T9SS type A sorting domain-containing protein [Candidatus Bathyarchaeia archaeon]